MIRLLDDATVGAIAAGEVVERPLSVVKELVENALDAGATRVAVSLGRGGLESIQVADNGCGIAPHDLQLAFARHATSKLARADDLERIATLGFRGEGLASIAAVARVRLVSRTAGSETGFAVDAHASDVSKPSPLAAPPGTRVIVRELFGNVPVRREYLHSPAAELGRISTFLATLALGYPDIAFSLAHDGRAAFAFPPEPALAQRLAHVFGAAAHALIALESQASATARVVRGFISAPGSDRADRRMQLLFVNGRLLRSTLLAGAWSAGYATFALAGRQPFGVLFLDLPPQHVDPNVHPTKFDVRLRNPQSVHDAVRRTIASTLNAHAATRLRAAISFAPSDAPSDERFDASAGYGTPDGLGMPDARATPVGLGGNGSAAYRVEPFAFGVVRAPRVAELSILAQLDDTFVLATDGAALVLVDQHAAHERVAFEALVDRASNGAPSEALLLPYAVELDAHEAERFERSRATLAQAGFETENFGERTYRVVATPAGYGARAFDVRALIADLADETAGLDARERVLASLACHSVVRAGDRLEHAEMTALVARLVRARNPMHCPHGRPTIVRIEADAVARMFKR